MRIATWNLEWGRSRRIEELQMEVLDLLEFDLAVLTEPSALALATGAARYGCGVVTSLPEADGPRPWVAVLGPDLEPAGPPGQLSVAATTAVGDRPVVVLGTVLPWIGATHQVPNVANGRDWNSFLRDQVGDQAEQLRGFLASDQLVIWAGDFNNSLLEPIPDNYREGTALLRTELETLGFEAWNRSALHANGEMHTIDLICGPAAVDVGGTRTISRVHAATGAVLSDHLGYVVDLHLP